MRLAAQFPGTDLVVAFRREEKVMKEGLYRAVGLSGKRLKTNLRADVLSAKLGLGVANAWRDEYYPQAGPISMEPAAVVRSKAPRIIAAFSEGGVIRSPSGLWLAIPTQAAGRFMGRRRMTPYRFEVQTGLKLRFVYRRTPPSFLVADEGRLTPGGTAVNRRTGFGGRILARAPRMTIIVFLLVPQVYLAKRFDLDKRADEAMYDLGATIEREIGHERRLAA